MNSLFFKRELDLIVDEDLRMAVKCYFDEKVPKYVLELKDTTIVQAKTVHDLDITDEAIIETIDKYVTKLSEN